MNIGLIGYGFMGGAHAAAIQQIPGVTLAALAARTRPSPDAAVKGNLDLKTAPLSDSVRWTPDWEDIVNDPSIHAVDICVPTHLHRPIIEAAFANGKHVLCEKPMALTVDDCNAILALAADAGKTFMVAQVLRWMWPYPVARDFVHAAGTGAVTACILQRSTGYPQWSQWLGKREISGGAILDLLSHDLDQALQWFGEPRTVRAVRIGPVDTMRATLSYANGLDVIVEGGWKEPEVPFSASFSLQTAASKLNFADGALTLTSNGNTQPIVQPGNDAYLDEIAYFVECCRTGNQPVLCMPAESAKAVTLSLLLEQSRQQQGRELAWQ